MKNPWEEMSLSDYENHMQLDSVYQLQTLSEIMKEQFDDYAVKRAAVLGVAGGNGLEHVDPRKYKAVYGIDINTNYLRVCKMRYNGLGNALKILKLDLSDMNSTLPKVDLIIANLFIEYIGTQCFAEQIKKTMPKIVSCVIQVNGEAEFVSDSPYIGEFDGIAELHRDIDEAELTEAMNAAGYDVALRSEKPLPNGKAFVRLDYAVAETAGESNEAAAEDENNGEED